jgi:hypothetical protein
VQNGSRGQPPARSSLPDPLWHRARAAHLAAGRRRSTWGREGQKEAARGAEGPAPQPLLWYYVEDA